MAARFSDLSEADIEELPPSVQSFALNLVVPLRELWRRIELAILKTQFLPNQRLWDWKAYSVNFGVKIPSYPPAADDGIEALNDSIKNIWPRGWGFDISIKNLATLCSLLLDSSAHPDINTCNLILNAFYRAGRHDLVDITIDLVLDGNFRPNEITCAEVLRSYRKRGLSKKYLEFLSLMRGSQSGLMTATPSLNVDESNKLTSGAVLPKAPGDATLIQAIKPSPMLYTEIVQGLLKFVGLQKTLQVCQSLYLYGWGWSYACMHKLLFSCAVELEWDICWGIWKVAQLLCRDGNQMPKQIYARMLAYCSLSKREDIFSEIFAQSLTSPTISAGDMLKMVRAEMDNIALARAKRTDPESIDLDLAAK